MSRTIDERIVEMQFNNQQFEQNVQTSIGTLEKLKQALNFGKSANGLDSLNAASRKFDMSGVSNAVDTVKSRFSAMEIVGVTALVNIANQAVNSGKQLLNSLTLAPISQGFNEYELKMGSVQTIIASTGEKLSTVSKYLDDLNTYSDKTIYSFKDMTSNIGKFTNAGVKLEDAVAAIKGVSNVAAVSGANAAEASRAMYNFSQALSSGAVKLIDWKSIENANMSTVEFKDTLMQTAVALGTVVKEGDAYRTTTTNLQGKVSELFTSTKGFNEALAHQWMTTDVLTTALSIYSTDVRELTDKEREEYEEKLRGLKFTDEQIKKYEELGIKAADSATELKTFSMLIDTLQEAVGSGWAQTWEILFGDFEEAKKLWTEVNNVVGGFIDRSSDARNELLKGWKDAGGRAKLIEALSNAFKALQNVMKPFSDAFRTLFPPMTSKTLVDLTEKFLKFTETIKNATENFPMKLFNAAETNNVVTGFDTAEKKVEDFTKKTEESTEKVTKSFEKLREAVRATIQGDYGNGDARTKALEAAGYNYKEVQDYVNKIHELTDGKWDTSDKTMDAAEKALGLKTIPKEAEKATVALEKVEIKVEDVVSQGNILTDTLVAIGRAFQTLGNSGLKILGAIRNAWGESSSNVTVTLEDIMNFYEAIDGFSSRLKISDETLSQIQNTAKKFFTTFKDVAALVIKFGLRNLPVILDIVSTVAGILGGIVLALADLVGSILLAADESGLFEGVLNGLSWILQGIANFVHLAATAINYFGRKLHEAAVFASSYIEKHQVLQHIAEGVSKVFSTATDAVVKFGTAIAHKLGFNTIEEFGAKINDLIDTIGRDFIAPGFENFVNLINSIATGKENPTGITSKLGSTLEGIKTDIKNFVGNIPMFDSFSDALTKIKTSFENFTKTGDEFEEGTVGPLEGFKGKFESFINGISENLGKVNWVGVAAVIGQIGTMAVAFEAIVQVAQAVHTGRSLVMGVNTLMSTVNTFVGNVNNTLSNYTVSKGWVSKFKTISKSIVMLAGSIFVVAQALIQVGQLPQEQFEQGAKGVIGIIIALTAMEILISKAGKGIEIGSVLGIVGFAIAIVLVVKAIKDMANLVIEFQGQADVLQDAFWDIVVIMGAMVGVIAVLSVINKKLGPMGGFKNMLTVVGFVLALKLLVGVMQDLAKLNIGGFWEFVDKLGLALGALLAISAMTTFAGAAGGFGVLAIVVALKLLVGALKQIAEFDMNAAKKNIGALIYVIAVLATLMLIISMGGSNALKAGIGILAISIALYLMVGVINLLGSMDAATATKGVTFLVILMFGIAVMMTATVQAGEYALRAGAAILLISIAINLLVLPVFLLGSMRADKAMIGVFAVLLLMGGIAVMMAASIAAGQHAIRAGVAILLITIAINGLVYAIFMMSEIQPAKLYQAIFAIGLLSIMMGALMVLSKFTGTSSWGGIIAIAVAVTLLSLSLVALANVPMENLEQALTCLKWVGLIMGGLMVVSKLTEKAKMGNIIALSVCVGLLAILMAAIAVALKKFDVDGDTMLKQFSAMAIAVVSIGSILALLSAFKVNPATAAKAALGFGAFTGLLIIIAGFIGELDSLTGNYISGSLAKAEPVFEAIGRIIGSLIKGVLTPLLGFKQNKNTEEAKSFAEELNSLVDGLVTAAGKLAGQESALKSLDNLVGIVGAFAKAEFLNGITSLLGGDKIDLSVLGSQLARLAEGLVEFSKTLSSEDSNINSEIVDKAIEMARKLAELYGMPELKDGGFVGWLLGNSIGFVQLGDSLDDLATGLATYAQTISEKGTYFKDESTIKASEKLLKFVATIYGMPELKQGGFIGSILGKSIGLDALGGQLTKLAEGLSGYVEKLAEKKTYFEDESTIKASENLLDFVSTIYGKEALKQGGFIGSLLGDSIGLDTLGGQLTKLAVGLAGYAEEVSKGTFDEEQLKKAETLLDFISDLGAREGLKTGGLLQAIIGETIPFDKLGEQLSKLGAGMGAYAKSLNDNPIDMSQALKSQIILDMLAKMSSTNIPKTGGLLGMIFGNNELSKFAKGLSDVAVGITGYINKLKEANLSDADLALATRATTIIGTIAASSTSMYKDTSLKVIGDALIKYADSVKKFFDKYKKIQETVKTIDPSSLNTKLGEILASIKDFYAATQALPQDVELDFTTIVNDLASSIKEINDISDAIIDTFTGSIGKITDAFGLGLAGFNTIISSAMEDAKSAFNTAGADMVAGLTSAFQEGSDAFSSSAQAVVSDGAAAAAEKKDDWVKVGEKAAAGIGDGLTKKKDVIKRKGKSVNSSAASDIKDSVKSSWKKVGEAAGEGIKDGLGSKESSIKSKAREVARAAYNAARSELNINSPSRLFAKLGEGIDEGLVLGMDRKERIVTSEAKQVVQKMFKASNDSVNKLVDLMNSEMVDDPIIKPVIDLSDVQTGTHKLYSMMSDVDQFTLHGNVELATSTSRSVDTANRRREESRYDATNALIDAIDGLSALIGNTGNTYNVNGITYDDQSNIAAAINMLVRAAKVGGRA